MFLIVVCSLEKPMDANTHFMESFRKKSVQEKVNEILYSFEPILVTMLRAISVAVSAAISTLAKVVFSCNSQSNFSYSKGKIPPSLLLEIIVPFLPTPAMLAGNFRQTLRIASIPTSMHGNKEQMSKHI